MKIFIAGDIVGKPGRKALKELYPGLRDEFNIDFAIVNGENMAGGSGITQETLEDVLSSGIDVVTSGDHIWKKKETQKFVSQYPMLLRPANFPSGVPGKGSQLIETKNGKVVGVINLLGRVFMTQTLECPFLTAKREVDKLKDKTDIIIVDFHAEATAEKIALGWFLDGYVSVVVGTHTHVQTADETILPNKTAYITDIGMVGARYGVIGRKKEGVIERFLTQMPARFELAVEDVCINAVLVDIDDDTGKAISIERIVRQYK